MSIGEFNPTLYAGGMGFTAEGYLNALGAAAKFYNSNPDLLKFDSDVEES